MSLSDHLVERPAPPLYSTDGGCDGTLYSVSQNTKSRLRLRISDQFSRTSLSDVRQDTFPTFMSLCHGVGSIPIRLATLPAVGCRRRANEEVSVTEYEERSDRFT